MSFLNKFWSVCALLMLALGLGWLPAVAAVPVDPGTGPQGPMILPDRPKPQKKPGNSPISGDAATKAKAGLKKFFHFSGRTLTPEEKKQMRTDKVFGKNKPANELELGEQEPQPNPIDARTPINKDGGSDEAGSSAAPAGSVDSLAIPTAPKAGATVGKRTPLLSPSTTMTPVIEEPRQSPDNPPRLVSKKIDDPANPLGLTSARNRLKAAQSSIAGKHPQTALLTLEPLKDWLITATEAHIDLYKTLNRLPSARVQAEFEKQLALEFAKLRDQALLELSRLYLQQGKREQAIKLLVAVVQSQTRSPVGLDAYQLLQDIGFTEALQLTE